jgi:hypothetical protein
MYDTQQEAVNIRQAIIDTPNDQPSRPTWTADDWKITIEVVSVPDEAVAKFDEVKSLTDWCFNNPKDGVPEGSTENSLFHRGREIDTIIIEGYRILMEHMVTEHSSMLR